jgi:UDP-N-acetyl-D-glucosamine dehydrogenase
MPYHVVSSVTAALNHQKTALNGARIMILGVAYKKDIDDLRESPALTIIELLQEAGAEVLYNDPYIPSVDRGRKYNLQMKSTPLDRLGEYDCVLIVTDHSSYDYEAIVRESKLVVDSRNATKGICSSNINHC